MRKTISRHSIFFVNFNNTVFTGNLTLTLSVLSSTPVTVLYYGLTAMLYRNKFIVIFILCQITVSRSFLKTDYLILYLLPPNKYLHAEKGH